MTIKELINQYVTAHADNRWMDASELEALLTEFADELMKDAIDTRIDKKLAEKIGYQGNERVKVIIVKE